MSNNRSKTDAEQWPHGDEFGWVMPDELDIDALDNAANRSIADYHEKLKRGKQEFPCFDIGSFEYVPEIDTWMTEDQLERYARLAFERSRDYRASVFLLVRGHKEIVPSIVDELLRRCPELCDYHDPHLVWLVREQLPDSFLSGLGPFREGPIEYWCSPPYPFNMPAAAGRKTVAEYRELLAQYRAIAAPTPTDLHDVIEDVYLDRVATAEFMDSNELQELRGLYRKWARIGFLSPIRFITGYIWNTVQSHEWKEIVDILSDNANLEWAIREGEGTQLAIRLSSIKPTLLSALLAAEDLRFAPPEGSSLDSSIAWRRCRDAGVV